MKIAVLSSPSARNRFEMGSALGHFLEGDTILTHPLWGDVPSGRMIASLENGAHLSYKEAVRQAVTRFLEEGAGLFVTIGGDGLASYVADALVCGTSPDSRPGIIGVAAGTANVGPIVSLSIQDLKRCNRSDSTMKPLDAVEATLAGRHLGYGFNDIVLGNTVLATVDGKTCNCSARILAEEGRNVITIPGNSILTKEAVISRNGKAVFQDSSFPTRQVVICPLGQDRLYGRAVYGAFCNSWGPEGCAGISVTDRAIVDTTTPDWFTLDATTAKQALFARGDVVKVTGLGEDADIIIDGNPFPHGNEDGLLCTLQEKVITACRLKEGV